MLPAVAAGRCTAPAGPAPCALHPLPTALLLSTDRVTRRLPLVCPPRRAPGSDCGAMPGLPNTRVALTSLPPLLSFATRVLSRKRTPSASAAPPAGRSDDEVAAEVFDMLGESIGRDCFVDPAELLAASVDALCPVAHDCFVGLELSPPAAAVKAACPAAASRAVRSYTAPAWFPPLPRRRGCVRAHRRPAAAARLAGRQRAAPCGGLSRGRGC